MVLSPAAHAATITISPSAKVIVQSPAPVQLKASVSGASNTAVKWSLSYNLGTISSTGLYTPPSRQTSYNTVVAKATLVADSRVSATKAINLFPYAGTAPTPSPSPSVSPRPSPSPSSTGTPPSGITYKVSGASLYAVAARKSCCAG